MVDIQSKLETYRTQLSTQKGRVAELERALELAKAGTNQLEGAILALEDLARANEEIAKAAMTLEEGNGVARPDA